MVKDDSVYRRRSFPARSLILAGTLFVLTVISAAERLKAMNDFAAGCCQVPGDVDHNGKINVSDVTVLVAHLFKGGPDLVCPAEADLNSDVALNISDLTFLIEFLFRGGAAPGECPPLIAIKDLEPGDDSVRGSANVSLPTGYRVVLWAKTDRWYVQPTTAQPFTVIRIGGRWSNFTNPWTRIAALLVDSDYIPGAIREDHPAVAAGVVDWDEYPERSPDRYIDWSNFRWRVKQAELTGPGPNAFSDDTANVRIDQDGRLHLRIDYRNGVWYCAEIVLDHALGYGTYTFRLDSRVDNLNYNTIFAGFLFDTSGQEFDMEFSQFLADPHNAQFVVQPWYLPGNIEFYDMPDSAQTSFTMEWRSDHITFTSWLGHADAPEPNTLLHTWTYTGANIPAPSDARVRFNLYLANGDPPSQGHEDEVVVASFGYSP